MSRREPWVTQNFRVVLQHLHASKIESNYGRLTRDNLAMLKPQLGSGCWMHPALQLNSTSRTTSSDSNEVKNVEAQPPVPSSPSFITPNWLKWVLRIVLSLLLRFWNHNQIRQRLQKIEGEAEVVVEEVEAIANSVEKLEDVVEEIAEDVAEHLSEDSKLKNAALVVERLSKQAADFTEEFSHKVDVFQNELDDWETLLEPFIEEK
ncbi:uncharacterized protein G2W53_005299 [Senna tora]|uniref:Uncharacterized protein n=1 Tax=Senna tora TaxID=362788 RepID=A0A835CIZ4_9FABA|nr:uncharacterized protein G2W53_005299 [Senna tora]